MMKITARIFPLFLLAGILIGCSAGYENADNIPHSFAVDEEQEVEPIPLYFFHDTACGSCNGDEDFMEIYAEQLEGIDKNKYSCRLYTCNTFETSGRNIKNKVAAEWGISVDSIQEPSMLLNGQVFNGMDSIRTNLREQYLSAWEDGRTAVSEIKEENILPADQLFDEWKIDPSEQTVIYFYRITCDECIKTEPIVDAVPETIRVNGEETSVNLIKINSRGQRNSDRIYMLFEEYEVPEKDQMVPIVFLREEYLAGYEQISTGLTEKLEQGAGLNFTWPE